jgi:hypothetical protein
MKIYLDINQFGTPHWLGELARIDPTTIREYNKQQWINAMKAKTEAAYAARKVRVLGDANPYHEPAGSPKGGQFARAPGAKEAWIREKVDNTADKLNFPKDRIHLSTGVHKFMLNGVEHTAGGIAVYSKDGYTQADTGEHFGMGDIVIFDWKGTGFNEDIPVTGVVAHEIEHQMFRQVMDRYDEELKSLEQRYGRDGLVDRGRTAETGMFMPRPDLEKEFPTLTAIGKTDWQSAETAKRLVATDGVTDYSKEYWVAHSQMKATYSLAVNETLAEIANLDIMGELRNAPKDISFDDVEKFVIEDITNEPGYDEEERRRAKQDPWDYADAVNRDKFYKKFGFRWDELGFDVGKRTVEVPDFTDSALYKVISPEWRKLYDTINDQYKRINNITDAGFDEDQPRDEEGQWTSGGPVRLKLGGKMRTLSRNDWASTKATLDLFKGAYMNPMNDQEMIWAWNGKSDKEQRLAFMEFGPAHDEDTVYLKHIRTFPQREGAGRLAMEKVMKYAGEKGMGIYLDVARNSSTPYRALRKFYTGLGFKGKGDSLIWRP